MITDLIAWSSRSISLKDLLFLSFHRVQTHTRGDPLSLFLFLSLQKIHAQLRRVLLAVECNTKPLQMAKKTATIEYLSWVNERGYNQPILHFSLHIKYYFDIIHPLLLSWWIVKILSHSAPQAKKPTFIDVQGFQTILAGKVSLLAWVREDSTYFPFLPAPPHIC